MAMVSVIVPFFNAELYLQETIQSVVSQSYTDFELILINDGSTDGSKAIVQSFDDKRIVLLEQENMGVSAARNLALENMRGDYFCFLDADDVLPPNSLYSRVELLENNKSLDFVDGHILVMDENLKELKKIWKPSFHGNPFQDLTRLRGKSFFNPSWMIRVSPKKNYRFNERLTHGEDLLFYLELSKYGGLYSYVEEPILKYRNTPGSAMKNLRGLENGYRYIESILIKWPELSKKSLLIYKYKYRRAMALAYLRKKQFKSALCAIL